MATKICRTCNEKKNEDEFPQSGKPYRQSRCRKCWRKVHRKYELKYRKSQNGIAVKKIYDSSPSVMALVRKYQASDKGKAWRKKYQQSQKYLDSQNKHAKSVKGKASRKKFWESEKGREARVRYAAKRKARKLEQICSCCDPRDVGQAYASGWMGETCYICLVAPATQTDHVIPLASGKPGDGLHCLKNFRSACKPCNTSKNARQYPGTEGWDDFLVVKRNN